MTTEGIEKLTQAIATAQIGRSTGQAITYLKKDYSAELQAEWEFVVENALVNIMKNTKRRKAHFVVDQRDLFAPFDLPALVPHGQVPGSNEPVNEPIDRLSKQWLRDEIAGVKSRPSQKEIKLQELQKLFNAIDAYCADTETIGTGLMRASSAP